MAQGTFGDIVDDDLTINGGATYWPTTWPVGLSMDLAYQQLDVSSAALRAINDQIPPDQGELTGGDVEIWQFTTNAIWSPKTNGPIGFYVTGGAGVYFLDGRLTNTGLVYYPPVCEPWYWWCYPGGSGPGTIVQASESATELGYNLGVGVTFENSEGSQWYIEARYHSVDTTRESTEFVPLVIGYRW